MIQCKYIIQIVFKVKKTMSSSDEFEAGDNSCVGYQYEPEFTEEELAATSVSNHNIESDEDTTNIDDNFCTCENCIPLQKRRESLCCRDFQHYNEHYITEVNSCITLHSDFDIICLNKTVLETAYVIFMRYKKMKGRAPDLLTPR